MNEIFVNNKDYTEFLIAIKNKIKSSQLFAMRAVNKELISLYWEIGKSIVLKQEEQGWGKSVVEVLSCDLQIEFPGIKGFSARNLWRMKSFYTTYSADLKLPQLVAEIGWSHNALILEKCKDNLEREYYIQMTRNFGWSRNVLEHNIEVKSYESFLTNQTSFDRTIVAKYQKQAKLAVKDEYNFGFLDLGEEYLESELERKLIANIQKFLLEMGPHFTFIGSQYRIEVDEREFFIDLLLYHRGLSCMIALELKRGEFQPEYVGKMNFYLTALDKKVKLPNENPSIGIIICKNKSRTLVEYTLHDTNKPVGVATYTSSKSLPKSMIGILPSPDEIINHLKVFDDLEDDSESASST